MDPIYTNPASQVPRAPNRNPFKAGSMFARQYDGMLKAYADQHRDVLRENGSARCMGNNMATAFWRGYDGAAPHTVPRDALTWPCYRAGQAQRRIDDGRGVYVPPKSNSIVRP